MGPFMDSVLDKPDMDVAEEDADLLESMLEVCPPVLPAVMHQFLVHHPSV